MSATPGRVINIVVAGIGGQGVLKASDIIAVAALHAGFDVKKSEVHGMSQRGGSVTSDVRYGVEVFSPMVPPGAADFVLVLSPSEIANNRWHLRPGGMLIAPDAIDQQALRSPKTLNVALLGVLSRDLDIPEADWHTAIRANLPDKVHTMNLAAFETGRQQPRV
jgi:indolepyruvate ferredoxin oxidoreductase, beta subunit